MVCLCVPQCGVHFAPFCTGIRTHVLNLTFENCAAWWPISPCRQSQWFTVRHPSDCCAYSIARHLVFRGSMCYSWHGGNCDGSRAVQTATPFGLHPAWILFFFFAYNTTWVSFSRWLRSRHVPSGGMVCAAYWLSWYTRSCGGMHGVLFLSRCADC
jgi:hypothetical protein